MSKEAEEVGDVRQAVAERRHMTVLFSDLCSSTELGHRADPDVLDAILQKLKAVTFPIVESHGGTIVQFHGDGILAVFGYPVPQEDDVRRAVETAVDLHEAVRQLDMCRLLKGGSGINLHSGVHAGLVLIREGDAVQGRFELVGDPPNTAAGLSDYAGVDEIIVSEEAVRSCREFFDVQEVPPAKLKGKPAIPVLRVIGRSNVETRFEARSFRGLTPFIGRQEILAALRHALERARRDGLQQIRLLGDAGIGKTRTLEQFLASSAVREFAVLRGYCEHYGAIAPFQPFVVMLRHWFGVAGSDTPSEANQKIRRRLSALQLEHRFSEVLDGLGFQTREEESQQFMHVISEIIVKLAEQKPILLCIDDWQWVDDASRQLLNDLIPKLSIASVAIITATRQIDPGELDHSDLEVVRLKPFSPDESIRVIEALTSERMAFDLAARLFEQSGGNPLFLEELCENMLAVAPGSHTEVPTTLHGLIEARTHRLSSTLSELVCTCAVIGVVVSMRLLEEVLERSIDDSALQELADQDLLYPGESPGTIRFKHGLTRDAIYASVPLRERHQLHAKIARVMKNRGSAFWDIEALAYHHAGAEQYEEAALFAERAGERALSISALDRARQQFLAALSALDQLPETPGVRKRWLHLSQRLAFACIFSPRPEHLEILKRAVTISEEMGDLSALGLSRFWVGFMMHCFGDHEGAIKQYRQGLRVADRSKDQKLFAQLRANLAECYGAYGSYREALPILDEAIDYKRRLAKQKPEHVSLGSAYAVACKAHILADLGEFGVAQELVQEASAALRGSGSPVEASILGHHMVVLLLQGRWEECIALSEEVEGIAKRVSGSFIFGRARCEAGYSQFQLTHDDESVHRILRATEFLEEAGYGLYLSMGHGYLAEIFETLSHLEIAWRQGQKALERVRHHDFSGEGMACRALAKVATRGYSPDGVAAQAYLERATEAAKKRGSKREIAMTQLTEAELAIDCGDRDHARQLLDQVLIAFEQMHMDWYVERARSLDNAIG